MTSCAAATAPIRSRATQATTCSGAAEGDRLVVHPDSTYTIIQQGADTLVDFGAGDSVVLVGVQLGSMSDGWVVIG